MTIGPVGDIGVFRKLKAIKDQLEKTGKYGTLELSMGMSADYQQAIIEGATVVRIGSALFGPRTYPPK